ncbi:MAG: hypothetical protein HY814_10670 [Candidatus Riflebacteria bacterium]|nr:hypothetical protein [Candidatus Riflebacteria bacterium]
MKPRRIRPDPFASKEFFAEVETNPTKLDVLREFLDLLSAGPRSGEFLSGAYAGARFIQREGWLLVYVYCRDCRESQPPMRYGSCQGCEGRSEDSVRFILLEGEKTRWPVEVLRTMLGRLSQWRRGTIDPRQ